MSDGVNTIPPGRHHAAEKERKKKRLIIILVFVLVILLALFGAYKFGLFDIPNESGILIGAGVKEGEIDPDTGEEASTASDSNQEGANGKSNMTVKLNGYPVFDSGSSEGNLNIVNPATNVLYMLVEITLDETGEKIYESGAIPPGHYIDNDKLTEVLEKGTHNATAHVTLYDSDNPDKEFNGADFNLTITVKN